MKLSSLACRSPPTVWLVPNRPQTNTSPWPGDWGPLSKWSGRKSYHNSECKKHYKGRAIKTLPGQRPSLPARAEVGWVIRPAQVTNLDESCKSPVGCGCDSEEGMLRAPLTFSLSTWGGLESGQDYLICSPELLMSCLVPTPHTQQIPDRPQPRPTRGGQSLVGRPPRAGECASTAEWPLLS